MHDNKVRLSQDILEKAELIAAEWGLKNARAAVEAVFRRYSDEYLNGRGLSDENSGDYRRAPNAGGRSPSQNNHHRTGCEALDELEDLLAM